MAQIDYGHYIAGSPEPGHAMLRAPRLIGALISAGLIAGGCVWGYKLLLRQAVGIPTIVADDTPMRVRPEETGGRLVANTGLQVNAIPADGSAAGPAERIILAPAPVELAEEDVAQGDLLGITERGDTGSQAAQKMAIDSILGALAESGEITVAPPAEDAPGASRRPSARPAALDTTGRTVYTDRDRGSRRLDVAQLVPGMHVVQLGTFGQPDLAQQEWDRLAAKFRDYLSGRDYVIQPVTGGGKEFHRLRVTGFDGAEGARRFCSALTAEGAECIPVTIR